MFWLGGHSLQESLKTDEEILHASNQNITKAYAATPDQTFLAMTSSVLPIGA